MLIEFPEGVTKQHADVEKEWDRRIIDFKAGKLRAEDSPRISKACDLIKDYHNAHPNEKTVVFSVFVRSIDVMDILLKQRGYKGEVVRIDDRNGTDLEARQSKLDKFHSAEAGSVLLTSFSCLQEGPTITAASHIVFLDCTWTPVNEEQAISRVYQQGQEKSVTVEMLCGSSWIDSCLGSVRNRKRYPGHSLLEYGSPALEGMPPKKTFEDFWPKYSDNPVHEDPDRAYLRNMAERPHLACINHPQQLDPRSLSYGNMELFNDIMLEMENSSEKPLTTMRGDINEIEGWDALDAIA